MNSLRNNINIDRQVSVFMIHTSDVHGNLFGYDYLKRHPLQGGLHCVASYVNQMRLSHPDAVVLTDGGDFLQGQPLNYYYNYIRTDVSHVVSNVMNEMQYDCAVIGNHDLETGHEVYDRITKELKFPLLGANVIDVHTLTPYFKPYHVVERQGVRIALLGMTSQAIPGWLPPHLWKGLLFEDVVLSTQYWVKYIQENEDVHLIVGLFHTGLENGVVTEEFSENVTREVAKKVEGLDLIFYGHDHTAAIIKEKSPSGNDVFLLNPSSFAFRVSVAEIRLTIHRDSVVCKKIRPSLPKMSFFQKNRFAKSNALLQSKVQEVEQWLQTPIGNIDKDIYESEAFFGSSGFVDLIHSMQLQISKAQISFASPLNYDSIIKAGTLTIQDTFSLYKFENFLVVMRMTGREIKHFLEFSYAKWSNQMTSPDDHILLLSNNMDKGKRMGLINLVYNFDSAAGIFYTVDVTKSQGEKIQITTLFDGNSFNESATYSVVMNSYRANGGGELMTLGAGIKHIDLQTRIISSTEKDLRYYFIKFIEKHRNIKSQPMQHWHFIPNEWATDALKRDRKLLFGEEKK